MNNKIFKNGQQIFTLANEFCEGVFMYLQNTPSPARVNLRIFVFSYALYIAFLCRQKNTKELLRIIKFLFLFYMSLFCALRIVTQKRRWKPLGLGFQTYPLWPKGIYSPLESCSCDNRSFKKLLDFKACLEFGKGQGVENVFLLRDCLKI